MTQNSAKHDRNDGPESGAQATGMPVTRTMDVPGINLRLEKALQLEFVLTHTLHAIPRRLFEGSVYRTMIPQSIDRFYACANTLAASQTDLFHLLLDRKSREIHGLLWLKADPIDVTLSVYWLGVDPEYDDGGWAKRAVRWVFEQPFQWDTLQPYILWMTDQRAVLEAAGAEPGCHQRMVFTREAVKLCG